VSGNWAKNRYIVNNYILLSVLGTGSYAEVRLAKDRNTDQVFAVKVSVQLELATCTVITRFRETMFTVPPLMRGGVRTQALLIAAARKPKTTIYP